MKSRIFLLRSNWGSLFKSHGIKLEKVELTKDCLSIFPENCYLTITKKDSNSFALYWEKDNYKDYLHFTRAEILAMFNIEESGNKELENILQVNHYATDVYSINTKAYRRGDCLIVVNTEFPENSDSFLYLFVSQKLRNAVELFCLADSLPHFWGYDMWKFYFNLFGRNIIEIREESNEECGSLFIVLDKSYLKISKTKLISNNKEFMLEWCDVGPVHKKSFFTLSCLELLAIFDIQKQEDMNLFVNNRFCINSNTCRKENDLVIINTKSDRPASHLYIPITQELQDNLKAFLQI